MRKTLVAVLAVALLLATFCGSALASYGDVTLKSVKAYADAEMKLCVGTIPAYTALVVRSNDDFADVYIGGKIYYINSSALLDRTIYGDYIATLRKGTKVYQRPTTSANTYTLKTDGVVQICKVHGEWALVQTLGSRGLYAFVKLSKLASISKV